MPVDFWDPDLYALMTTIVALILLTLIVVSVPMEESYSFLHSNQANGVNFGMWGWCLDDGITCSPKQFGYTWPPEISTPITKSLALYLIADALTFLTLVAALLALCTRTRKARNLDMILSVLAWSSFSVSAIASVFTIAIYSTAKSAFEEHGFAASYGILTWVSPITTVLLFFISLRTYFRVSHRKESCTTAKVEDIES